MFCYSCFSFTQDKALSNSSNINDSDTNDTQLYLSMASSNMQMVINMYCV